MILRLLKINFTGFSLKKRMLKMKKSQKKKVKKKMKLKMIKVKTSSMKSLITKKTQNK